MSGTLHGRDADLAALSAFLAEGGGALLVTGEPGVGKSALLDRFAGPDVLRATGSEATATPYAALDRLLAPVPGLIDALPPADRSALHVTLGLAGGPPLAELAVAHALLRLLRTRPAVVVVDQGEDLDDASARIFAVVARRLRPGDGGAMILAGRSPWPHGLLQHAGLREYRLARLDELAAVELLNERHPGLAPHVRARLIAESEGIPLSLVEYAAALTGRQRSGTDPLPAVLPLGDRVRALTAAHFAGLPAATRDLLLLAALEATGDLTILQAATPGTDVRDAAAPAEQRQYVTVDADARRLLFRHPMLRAACLENATELEHRRAHRALARALDRDPDRQAVHLAAAAVGHDAELADRLRRLAETTIRHGDATAAGTLLTRAAELTADPVTRSRRLLAAALIRADVAGDLTDASHLLEQAAVESAGLADSLPFAVTAAQVVLNSGIAVDVAYRLLVAAVEAHPRRWDANDELLVEALHSLVMTCWFAADPALYEPLDRALARLRPRVPPLLHLSARAFGDPVRLEPALLDEIDAAVTGLADEHNPITITRTSLACVYTDRLGRILDPLARVRRGDAAALAIHATISTGNDLWHTGQWTELTLLAADGRARCDRFGYARYRPILGYHLALVAVARGDLESGLRTTGRMTAEFAGRGAGIGKQFAHHVHALAAIARGDFAEAYAQASAITPAGNLAPHVPHALWVLLDLVEGAIGSGHHDAARAHVTALIKARVDRLSSRLALCVAGCAAMVAESTTAYEKALAVPGADRWPFEQGRVLLAYGEHLRRNRETAAARARLAAALRIFQRLGARPWIERTETALRAAGRGHTHPEGAEALSAQERRIAELAAGGLTNKQIGERLHLSHRTVGAHLYRAFPKLGITSRAALRDALLG
ncbi:helix-turn-helix transcriptional regulator [Actinoplanes solisilvae]|uniref:helix-turn-helix transcriptional regulator n=1 Tax=Actinoplanes solisilvae TaxID=2486853 RepID=UPI000FDC1FAB|nr:LuxR C-terminal-related transcriptional regulator [Actinoplanes solisilvae]